MYRPCPFLYRDKVAGETQELSDISRRVIWVCISLRWSEISSQNSSRAGRDGRFDGFTFVLRVDFEGEGRGVNVREVSVEVFSIFD